MKYVVPVLNMGPEVAQGFGQAKFFGVLYLSSLKVGFTKGTDEFKGVKI